AARGLEEVRQEVEAGRLPGAVRADEGVDAAAVDLEVDVLDRDETPELLGQLACFKNAVVAHAPRPGGLLPGGLSTRTAGRATPAICRASAACACRGRRRCPRRRRRASCCTPSPRTRRRTRP